VGKLFPSKRNIGEASVSRTDFEIMGSAWADVSPCVPFHPDEVAQKISCRIGLLMLPKDEDEISSNFSFIRFRRSVALCLCVSVRKWLTENWIIDFRQPTGVGFYLRKLRPKRLVSEQPPVQ
jgi:hypothetical protein